ncbi:hypothetical protein KP509_06G045700 [Ceratopteris richardii]|uniref:Remorin C-terminal domain-containing protein n=1 Tax=Ceratopteris richardii TaxID=49495 RepID=A0A8T2UG31_CERRI|nr:hypothetical protein KP509_06G045700 [Ceratopteris richardii]
MEDDDQQPISMQITKTVSKEESDDANHFEETTNKPQNDTSGFLPESSPYAMAMEDYTTITSAKIDDHPSKALVLHNSTQQLDGAAIVSPTSSNLSLTAGSLNKDIVLAKLNQDRVLNLIKAWEDSVKAKSLNRLGKKLAKITAWEKANKARTEAQLQELEEKIENKRASFVETVHNEIAAIHRRSEEERAVAEAKHGEETLKAAEMATKYRACGKIPRKYAMCFWI